MGAAVAMMPSLSRLRVLRQWAGVMDMTMDGSPFICKTPVSGLYFNGGWCYGGFKATPASGWCFARTIAMDEPHPLNADLTIDRFREGRLFDERGAGPSPWAQ
jgi:sarcosine oxidase subunit beta